MLSFERPILESVSPDRWSLAGWVQTSGPLMPSGGSLKLIRRRDSLSPKVTTAMLAQSVVPVVEITTPDSQLTLSDVTILNVAPLGGSQRPPRGGNQTGSEYTRISITFRKITLKGKISGKTFKDDWSEGG